MIVTYSPEGSDPQEFKFRPREIRASEAEMIERRAGQSFETWATAVVEGSASARRVLLWHLLRRIHPALKWEDTPDFAWSELLVERERREVEKLIEVIAETRAISEEERDLAISELTKELDNFKDLDEDPTSAS